MIAAATVSLHDRAAIEDLYATYVALLDQRRYDEWIDLFTDDCVYRIVPRENDERGFPLATLAFESKDMLRDRIYGITQTLYHEPYYQRHLVSNFQIRAAETAQFSVEANYLVIQTKAGTEARIFSAGRYRDEIVTDANGTLRFSRKVAVFDTELIANSFIYPI